VKKAGYRQQLLMGEDLVRVRWQNSFWGVIRGLEKNSFAAVQYSIGKLIVVSVILAVVFFAPYMGVLFWRDGRMIPYLATVVLLHATYGHTALRVGGRAAVWPVLPLMFLMFLFLLWRSAVVILQQGGVRWRDTFYPLAELRRNQLGSFE
ncbi:MAG TPA: hypothetical protein VKU82_05780, partial [Planctomycetaceae bacterium]|nr:hypothetical protein [Planctomycetaceae bacterium]